MSFTSLRWLRADVRSLRSAAVFAIINVFAFAYVATVFFHDLPVNSAACGITRSSINCVFTRLRLCGLHSGGRLRDLRTRSCRVAAVFAVFAVFVLRWLRSPARSSRSSVCGLGDQCGAAVELRVAFPSSRSLRSFWSWLRSFVFGLCIGCDGDVFASSDRHGLHDQLRSSGLCTVNCACFDRCAINGGASAVFCLLRSSTVFLHSFTVFYASGPAFFNGLHMAVFTLATVFHGL
jgi:hypothetical protein